MGMLNKILSMIKSAESLESVYSQDYSNKVGVQTYRIGLLTLERFNGLFKAYWDGTEIGIISDESYTKVSAAIDDRRQAIKDNALTDFLKS